MLFMQDMINLVSRCWKSPQGQTSLALTSDKSLSSQKKEQSHSRHSIQSKLTRLYFEELSKVPHATPDSVLVCLFFKHLLLHFCLFFTKIYCNMTLYFIYFYVQAQYDTLF